MSTEEKNDKNEQAEATEDKNAQTETTEKKDNHPEENAEQANKREEYVFLAKLYERAERYQDMADAVNKLIELNPNLSKDERNIFSAGYKNLISDKRASWRLLNSLEKKELKKKSKQLIYIKEIKNHIEDELKKIFVNVQNLLDNFLIPNAQNSENKVFYLTCKADYFRYFSEINIGKDLEDSNEKAEEFYKKAYEISEKELPVINSVRIGLCLNYALFYYEVKGDKKKGCDIAKKAFEDSMKYMDDLEKFKSKDALLLIQLLKENLIFWNSEMNESEQNEN